MTFDELLVQVRELLQSKGRVSYRALKLQFNLDEEHLEGLKDELIEAERVATDEGGKVLVWIGKGEEAKKGNGEKGEDFGLRTPDPGRSSAERRQLTVMFIDVVGSTALSHQLDPEELREVIQAYRETCATVIRRFEGYLAKYIGDGLLVYFGYPAAHEDDAARAVRTGLEIVEAIQQLSFPTLQLPRSLQVRIGIHTGLVVAGEMGTEDQPEPLAIVGETPNIAARLQEKADPNSVVISPITYRLVQGLFECQDLSPQLLKGLSTPFSVYRVVGESKAQSRFEAAVQKGLTPLVGRTEEMEVLRERWGKAEQGAGQVVSLSGEPGIGKSRLVQQLTEQLKHERMTRIEFRCSPYHQNSALYPIINHLQRLLHFTRDDSPAIKTEKLQHTLSHYRFPQADTLPLLAALLSLPHPDGYPPVSGSPQKQKEKMQTALVAWLVEEAEQKTVYTIWEDLHWADPSTLEVLNLIVDQAPTAPLYVLLTFRPEFIPSWGNRSHVSQLTLSRLERSDIETMVAQVTGRKALSSEVVQQIVSKTDGVPLFVEELTKMVLESVESIDSVESQSGKIRHALLIPPTLYDALMARLDRMGMAKEIAQLGATIGREFSYELLQAVSPLTEESLQHGLKRLVEAELVYQRGLVPQAHYLFKHALIQDVAYQSLLKSKRQQYHTTIAQVLDKRFPETKETQPELLAHHYTEAGFSAQAIPYWQQAGQRANERSAHVEAISHLTRGLELLKTLPETPERISQELALQLAFYDALIAIKGVMAPEVEKTILRAQEMCRQLGETSQIFPILWRLCVVYANRGEQHAALELAEQMMRLAQSVQDRYLLSVAHWVLGGTLGLLGELTSARTHLEQAVALYNPQQHPPSTLLTTDLRVNCLSHAAWALWRLGYPDQALKRSQEVVALAEGLSHPQSLAYALAFAAAAVHLLRREEHLARKRAEAVMALSTEQGFPFWLAVGMGVRGWALVEQGQVEEGIAQIRQSRTPFLAFFAPHLLAEAYGKVGQIEEGLTVLAEALAFGGKTGSRVSEAELYRVKGQLTLQKLSVVSSQLSVTGPRPLTPDPQGEAEACFHKAIAVARKQQAKSLELRATTSLARLWQQQGKREEAHQMLSEIYGWFSEGFDTKDLQEAKKLVDSLNRNT